VSLRLNRYSRRIEPAAPDCETLATALDNEAKLSASAPLHRIREQGCRESQRQISGADGRT
jgi:hypothetical protein